MKNSPSKIALTAALVLALALTFSCSSGGGGNSSGSSKDSCITEIPDELQMDIYDASSILGMLIDDVVRPYQPIQPLSKLSSSGIAETGGNVVVCKDVVEARIKYVEYAIVAVCYDAFPDDDIGSMACRNAVASYASSPPTEEGKEIEEGRVLYILNGMLQ